jgi:23S rRNA maturation mini-RNase III
LRKVNGWHTAFNVLAVIADAKEDVRPGLNDYSLVVQLGEDEKSVAGIIVEFYNNETYHKLLTFMKDNGQNIVETSTGKAVRYQAFFGDYALELEMKQHIVSRTSARTADRKAVKTVDESYNEYTFTIRTDVEPWSEYLEKQAAKRAKRDAKGRKKKTVDEMM